MVDEWADAHRRNLEELVKPKGLVKVGENPLELLAYFMEPKYFCGNLQENKCPDLFLNYITGLWTVIELKHSIKARRKAFIQIESGYELLHDVFNIKYDDVRGKLVTYENGFMYEDYKIKGKYRNKNSL